MKFKNFLIAGLLLISSNAFAGWIWVADPDLTDDAINPGPANIAPAGPDSQSEANVGAWLSDLLNEPVTLLASGNSTPDVLNNLDDLGATYIVLHYGNYQGTIPGGFVLPTIQRGQGTVVTSNVNIAYRCDGVTSCDSFNPPNAGLSNYRIFGTKQVPEGGTMALLLVGALAIGLRRKFC